tara:strand:- start:6738 stop:7220 length:483 start_codon:yes stop_codon:yes gene_type:complete
MKTSQVDIGTKDARSQNLAAGEEGSIPRAKVTGQAFFDQYMAGGRLSLAQHQAAEYLLRRAVKAGLFAKGVDPSQSRGGQKDNVPYGIDSYADTLAIVQDRYGSYHRYLVVEVVCHNWDIGADGNRGGMVDKMKVLGEALQVISDRRLCGKGSPSRHLGR